MAPCLKGVCSPSRGETQGDQGFWDHVKSNRAEVGAGYCESSRNVNQVGALTKTPQGQKRVGVNT